MGRRGVAAEPWWHPEGSGGDVGAAAVLAAVGCPAPGTCGRVPGAASGVVAAVLKGVSVSASDTDPELCFNINSVCVCELRSSIDALLFAVCQLRSYPRQHKGNPYFVSLLPEKCCI